MGETTIEWAGSVCRVPCLMAIVAERNAVAHVETPLGVACERQKMMRPKVAAFGVAAVLACVEITPKDRFAPSFVLGRKAGTATLDQFPISIRGRRRPTFCDGANRCADLCADVQRHGSPAKRRRFPSFGGSHCSAGLRGMHSPLKGRNPSFVRAAHLDPRALLTARRQTIEPRPIKIEECCQAPLPAGPAPFFPSGHTGRQFQKRNSNLLRRDLQRTFTSLSHG